MKKIIVAIFCGTLFGCTSKIVQKQASVQDTPSKKVQPATLTPEEQLSFQRAHGRRETRLLKLENQLEVLLISDEKAEKSAAAMDVAVGSLMSPPEYLGLPHYLEHMLFLGTKKYPEASDYDKFIQQNGGYSNAFTANEDTNYHFEINTSAFEPALDRFAQFFIAPTFRKDLIPTEMKNVDLEYQKNRESTPWRQQYLEQSLSAPHHPTQNEFQGSLETLGAVPQKVLLDFYKKYYSANQMKLVIVSSLPLENLEKMVHEKFSLIPNQNRPTLTYPYPRVDPKQLPRLIEFQAADQRKSMTLNFYLPSTLSHWDSKPLSLLSDLMNYAGPGSLSSHLKKQGWILNLSSYEDTFVNSSMFSIDIELTEKGYKEYPKIAQAILAQLRKISNQGLSADFYQDVEKIRRLDYIFGSSYKGAQGASSLAKLMTQNGGAKDLESKVYLLANYDQDTFKKYLQELTPEHLTLFLSSSQIKGQEKSRFYDFTYTLKDLKKQSWYADLIKAPASKDSLPEKNQFLPQDLSLLDSSKVTPHRVTSNNFGVLWMAPSHFKTPRASLILSFLRNRVSPTPHLSALSAAYDMAVKESLIEWGYQARLAGMDYYVDSTPRLVNVTISGYSDRVSLFMESLLPRLKHLSLEKHQFQTVINGLTDDYQSLNKQDAYRRALHLSKVLRDPDEIDIEQWGPEIHRLSRKELLNFAESLFSKTYFTLMSYGNLTEESSTQLFQQIPKILNFQPLQPSERQARRVEIALDKGQALALERKSAGVNNAWVGWFSLGPKNLQNEALASLAGAYFGSPFYEELRTKRTLGYIAEAVHPTTFLSPALSFLIQSSRGADEVASIATEWSKDWADVNKNLSDGDFTVLQKGLLEVLRQPPESYETEWSQMSRAVFSEQGDFKYREHLATVLQATEKSDFEKALKEAFSDSHQRRLGVYVRTNHIKTPLNLLKDEVEIKDLNKFHRITKKYSMD